MKTNLLLVGLSSEFCEEISGILAENIDMYFADAKKIVEYRLLNDASLVEQKCGADYLAYIKYKTIKEVANYENTLIFASYDLLLDKNSAMTLRSTSTAIYLKIPKTYFEIKLKKAKDKTTQNEIKTFLLTYDERDKLLEESSDIRVVLNDAELQGASRESLIDKIKSHISDYFRGN